MEFDMDRYTAAVEESVGFLQRCLPWTPDVCLMLGTGLGGVAGTMDVAWSASCRDVPHFPVSTAPEHAGRLVVGTAGSTRVALFQGRFHYYEGYTARELTLPVRVMAGLGVRVFIGCNAAGGLNLDFSSGDLMVIRDHINMIPDNPLRGPNPPAWGPRFPDLSHAYSAGLRTVAGEVAARIGIPLREGVFVAVPGPSLETPAETRFLRMIGADAVAMSLVPEVIVAKHAGMEVLGISVIANINDPDNFRPILIEDVIEHARKAEKRLEDLLLAFLEEPRTWNG
jgi:purine-nucleoside phosphorylase